MLVISTSMFTVAQDVTAVASAVPELSVDTAATPAAAAAAAQADVVAAAAVRTLDPTVAATLVATNNMPTSGTTDPLILRQLTPPTTPLKSISLAGSRASVDAASAIVDESGPAAAQDTPGITAVVGQPAYATPAEARRSAADAAAQASVVTPAAMSPSYTEIFNLHNQYRARHRAPALVWNDNVAAGAAQWASNLAGSCNLVHGSSGENLAWTSVNGDFAGALRTAINMWYNEVSKYTYSNSDPANFAEVGHFTQVVWRSSTALGCAVQACANNRGTIVVCRYTPPGNVLGQFGSNVLPPAPSPSSPSPAPRPSPSPAPPPPAQETFVPENSPLPAGYCFASQNQLFWLCMQTDANLVLYKRPNGAWNPIWASNTNGRPNTAPLRAVLEGSGTRRGIFTVYDARNVVIWSSNRPSTTNVPNRLAIQNDGNVVAYDSRMGPYWATNTNGR